LEEQPILEEPYLVCDLKLDISVAVITNYFGDMMLIESNFDALLVMALNLIHFL